MLPTGLSVYSQLNARIQSKTAQLVKEAETAVSAGKRALHHSSAPPKPEKEHPLPTSAPKESPKVEPLPSEVPESAEIGPDATIRFLRAKLEVVTGKASEATQRLKESVQLYSRVFMM